jgi:hypothetical protein
MQQNRLHVLFFGLLAVVGLLLALTLISDHMSARAEEIQTECVQLTSVALHPGGRTIGGPGVFAGQCDGIPRPILKHGISGSTSGSCDRNKQGIWRCGYFGARPGRHRNALQRVWRGGKPGCKRVYH